MSTSQNAPETIFDAIGEMETGITNVADWAKAFQAVATSNELISPEVIYVMANALEELGERLEAKFHHARGIAQGQERLGEDGFGHDHSPSK